MNIYEKILEIMKEVQRIQKDDKVEYGSTSYKALSEEKVTTIMREQLLKQKLVVFPVKQDYSRQGTISHVDVTYRMVNTENPEEFIDIVSCGDGADSQDKGSGKAMTYAYKYMWLRTFAVPTGEDPDLISSEQLDDEEKKREEEKKKQQEIMQRIKKGIEWISQKTGKAEKEVQDEAVKIAGSENPKAVLDALLIWQKGITNEGKA